MTRARFCSVSLLLAVSACGGGSAGDDDDDGQVDGHDSGSVKVDRSPTAGPG